MSEVIKGEDLLRNIVWDDDSDYEVITSYQDGSSRWHKLMTTVFKRLSDGKLFMADWRQGATENQEHEYPDEAVECEPYEVKEIKYRALK